MNCVWVGVWVRVWMRVCGLAMASMMFSAGLSVHAADNMPVALAGSAGAVAAVLREASGNHDAATGMRLQLQLKAGEGNWQAFLRGDAASDRSLADSRGSSRLREAWLRYRAPLADVTLGRQLFNTGKTDVIYLQDQFMPRDLTQLALQDQEQQLGVNALRVDFYAGDAYTFTGALVRQDRSYVLPSQIASSLPTWDSLAVAPAAAALVRAEYRAGALELGIAASRGASPLPGIAIGPDGARTANPAERRFAVDGSLALGSGILRWDLVTTRNETTLLPGFSRRRHAFGIGWDQGVWQDANLSLQLIAREDVLGLSTSATSPIATVSPQAQSIYQANMRLSQAFRPHQRWVTATITQRIGATHQFETGLLIGCDKQRGLLQRWSWALADGWAVQAKAQFVTGGTDSLAGSSSVKRLAFVELRHQF
jgi:hypothetical protein